jgi:hypothetical protein
MGYQAQCFYNKKFLKTKVWKITNAITTVSNLIVVACVMNKSKGHWLLFDALTTYIVPTFNMEAEFEQD